MNILIEKLARTSGEQKSVLCDEKDTAELTALFIAKSGTFEESLTEMGDVINVGSRKFLVEADQSVTEIEQDEYAYYKNIPTENRINQWFSGSIN
jgi:hypothetical protein